MTGTKPTRTAASEPSPIAPPASDVKTGADSTDWIEGIDRRMEVMSPKPLVLSTPVKLLAENRIGACRVRAFAPKECGTLPDEGKR